MYNHYVRDKDGNYIRVSVEDPPASYIPAPHTPLKPAPQAPPSKSEPTAAPSQDHVTTRKNDPQSQRPPETLLVNKMLRHLNLGDIDSGDLLLLALLFFLFRQKADEELLIALGLLLIL